MRGLLKYTQKLVYAILAVIPVYLLFSATASALPYTSSSPGYCYSAPTHVLEQYMLRTVFSQEFSKELVSLKLKPLVGKIVEGYIPLRNWSTTVTDEYVLFEKKSGGMDDPIVGFIVGIEYAGIVDYIDVAMTQTTKSGQVYVWDNSPPDSLPYVQVPRVNIPVVEGIDDLTKVPLAQNYKTCYNEEYVVRKESPLLQIATSASILLLIVMIGFMITRKLHTR